MYCNLLYCTLRTCYTYCGTHSRYPDLLYARAKHWDASFYASLALLLPSYFPVGVKVQWEEGLVLGDLGKKPNLLLYRMLASELKRWIRDGHYYCTVQYSRVVAVRVTARECVIGKQMGWGKRNEQQSTCIIHVK